VPISTARNLAAPEVPHSAGVLSLLPVVGELPPKLAVLVRAWAAGQTQSEIARSYDIAYNTCGNRLELGYELLRVQMPDADEITYSMSDFNYASKVYVYHKPAGSCARWMARHPGDRRLGARECKPRAERPTVYAKRVVRKKAA
jgi:hypothetical protein